jgi:hypothetical protein
MIMARLSAMADVGLLSTLRSQATSSASHDDLVQRNKDESWTLPDGSIVDPTMYFSGDFASDQPFASVQGTTSAPLRAPHATQPDRLIWWTSAPGPPHRDSLIATPAPEGEVTIVFSDITRAGSLWEKHPAAMRDATLLHNGVMRSLLAQHRGYEAVFTMYARTSS